jgi:hypothetical protein
MKKILLVVLVCSLFYSITAGQNTSVNNNVVTVKKQDPGGFLASGQFFIGANYWASHAGPAMWSDWRADIVEQDLKKLADEGIRILRVFTNWSDFQPIHLLISGGGIPMEYRFGEELLPDDQEGKAGVSKEAMKHFGEFVSLAEKYDIKLIVGILTGHMSFRNFVPPAFVKVNPLTDPEAIKWEIRFIKYFVSRFKSNPAIIAWDLGNECNNLGQASPEDAWRWTSQITNSIKALDQSRPVISGMSSRSPVENSWNIMDLAETTDILTTHFYHIFTPYSELEPLNTIRPELAPVVQNILNEDIGGKPCFVEEFGTLGPLYGTDRLEGVKPGFLRSNLFSLWAHNCRGLLWWIAFDQGHLTQSPYDWNSRGSEYGLWFPDGSPKPVLGEIKAFSEFLSGFEYSPLPERITDGVCILTNGQDTWGTALSTFLLAKQAGLDIRFQFCTQPVIDSKLYFLPGIKGGMTISRHRMQELLEKVKNGAVLYISNDDGNIGPYFPEFTGLNVISIKKSPVTDVVTIDDGTKKKIELELRTDKKLFLSAGKAKILGSDQSGNPAFTCMDYGKGKVYFLNYPLEKYLSTKSGAFDGPGKTNYYKIYSQLKNNIPSNKVVSAENTNIGITEHPLNPDKRVIIVVNYFPGTANGYFKIAKGWKMSQVLYGGDILKEKRGVESAGNFSLKGNDAMVFAIERIPGVSN